MCLCVWDLVLCACVVTIFTSKVGTFLESEDLLAGPHNFKDLFEGSGLVLRLELDCLGWLGLVYIM